MTIHTLQRHQFVEEALAAVVNAYAERVPPRTVQRHEARIRAMLRSAILRATDAVWPACAADPTRIPAALQTVVAIARVGLDRAVAADGVNLPPREPIAGQAELAAELVRDAEAMAVERRGAAFLAAVAPKLRAMADDVVQTNWPLISARHDMPQRVKRHWRQIISSAL